MALPDYHVQRASFMAAAESKGAETTSYPHPLPCPLGEALYTDVARIGPASASRLMLVVSGTHGVEGYYGSDCQIAWLETLDEKALPADTALLLIHLLNPWGTAHLRRVNEDNIDLNRNFIDFSQPPPANPDYAQWHGIYHGDRASADRQLADALQGAGWRQLNVSQKPDNILLLTVFFSAVRSPAGHSLRWRQSLNSISLWRKPSSALTFIPGLAHGGIRCCSLLQSSVIRRMTGAKSFTVSG